MYGFSAYFYYICGKIKQSMEETKMVLRTEDLVKKYGKRTVVSHVSIDVKQGEIVGLLGPNGAGKTTSFYMTVGLITPNEGRIFLNDLDITKYPVYKRAQNGIGYFAGDLQTAGAGRGSMLCGRRFCLAKAVRRSVRCDFH